MMMSVAWPRMSGPNTLRTTLPTAQTATRARRERSRPRTSNSRRTDSPNFAERSIGTAPAFQRPV